jgi:broad specificity phosphatase PhoE
MKKIYFVRHGETTYNAEDKVQDHTPTLTQKGIIQATLVGDRLKNLSFDTLVSSDYERTKQTAEVIKHATGKEPVYSELFREIRRPSEFFHQPRKGAFSDFISKEMEQFSVDEQWKYSDEESFADVQTRISAAFDYLEKLDGDVVVISHGHFIRRVVATIATNFHLSGAAWTHMYQGFSATNTGITTIVKKPGLERWQILTFNDHAHFADN